MYSTFSTVLRTKWRKNGVKREIKQVDLDESMTRAIARQAEAERARRAKVINAEGEMQAAENLRGAAEQLAREPQALQLRYLQTLVDIAGENNSTIVFPLPMDILDVFKTMGQGGARPATADRTSSATQRTEQGGDGTDLG